MNLPPELLVVITAALPISELRGAIPLGIYLGLPFANTVALSIFGNILPVVPLLFLLTPVSQKLRHIPIWHKFFDWLFERTEKRANIIEKYEAIGLMFFVAIPFPVTGAWTGCVAATLFKIRFRYAFLAILAGIILASIIVSFLTNMGIITWEALIK